MNRPSEFVLVLVPRPSSSCSIFWRRDKFEDEEEDEDEHGSTWLKNGSWYGQHRSVLSTALVCQEGSILGLEPKVIGQFLWIEFDYNGPRS